MPAASCSFELKQLRVFTNFKGPDKGIGYLSTDFEAKFKAYLRGENGPWGRGKGCPFPVKNKKRATGNRQSGSERDNVQPFLSRIPQSAIGDFLFVSIRNQQSEIRNL